MSPRLLWFSLPRDFRVHGKHPHSQDKGPLLRAKLVVGASAPHDNVLLLTAHHIVVDGHGMEVLLHELGALCCTASAAA